MFEINLSDIKDIASLVTSMIVASVAITGLNTWRRQLVGDTEYQHARRLLKAVYQMREAIRVVRNPLITSEETSAAFKELGIEVSGEIKEILAKSTQAVYEIRWKWLSNAIESFDAEALEAEVLWGSQIVQATNELRKQVGELRWAIRILLNPPERIPAKESERVHEIVYDPHGFWEDSENSYTRAVMTTISQIENFLKPKLTIE